MMLVLPLALYSIIREPFVQTQLARIASTFLSEKLDANIRIGGLTANLMLDVVVKDLTMKDHKDSTLLQSSKMKLNVRRLNLNKMNIKVDGLSLQNASIGLYTHKGDTVMSYQFIINHLTGEPDKDTTTQKKDGLNFEVDELKLVNCRFKLVNENIQNKEEKINFSDLDITGIDLHVEKFRISSETDTIFFKINRLSATEKCGLSIQKLSGTFAVSPRCILADHLHLITNRSELSMNLQFLYGQFADFKDFLGKVRLNTVIGRSDFNLADIGYFAPVLFRMDNELEISGTFTGPVNNLKATNFKFHTASQTLLKCDINLEGLPDVFNTHIDLHIRELHTNKSDIESLSLPVDGNHLALPDIFNELGEISIQGDFKGIYNNFTSNAHFNTRMGDIYTDLNVSKIDKHDTLSYLGKLKAHRFQLGQLLSLDDYLGAMNVDADIIGSGLSAETVNINMNGTIDSMDFMHNNFNKILIHGDLSEKKFNGTLEIHDEKINLDFDGIIDFEKEIPVFDFYAKLQDADLYQLNLLTRDSIMSLSTSLNVNFKGLDLDDIKGSVTVDSTSYCENGKTYQLKNLVLVSLDDSAFQKRISLNSDYVHMNLYGDFMFNELISSIDSFTLDYLSKLHLSSKTVLDAIPPQQLSFDIQLEDYELISELFTPGLEITGNNTLKGYFNSGKDSLWVEGQADTVGYQGLKLVDWYLKNANNEQLINIETGSRKIVFKESTENDSIALGIDQFQIITHIKNDSVFYVLNWDDTEEDDKNKGKIAGYIDMARLPRVETKITETSLLVNDTVWMIGKDNLAVFDTTSIDIHDLLITSNNQSFKIDGKVSEMPEDTLDLTFKDWNISNFDLMYASDALDLDGIINGNLRLTNLYHSPNFITDIGISSMFLNKHKLGEAKILTHWANQDESLFLDVEVINVGNVGKSKTLDVNGYYHPGKHHVDFQGALQNFNLKTLGPALSGIFSDVEGLASGSFSLQGPTDRLSLLGNLHLMRAGLMVDYLNVYYTFSDDISLTEEGFVFDSIRVFDPYGNQALLDGMIYSHHFKEFELDLDIFPDNLACLHTDHTQNQIFYGDAFASGRMSIAGPTSDLGMNIHAETNKGTDVYIPISSQMDVVEKDYIIFSNTTDTASKPDEYNVNLSGLNLNLEVSVTPNAEIQIFLPYQMGDIKANGEGDIQLDINQLGDFKLFGDYKITEGTFLFTLRNLVSKKFQIMEGGTITWSGNPYDANINLRALYGLKTSLDGLGLVVDSTQSFSKRVNVNCIIELKNQLFDPEIKFSIQLPNAEEQTRQLVYAVLDTTDEAQMNQQMISLLVLGSFSYHTAGFNATAASARLISNQLSNWLSQISKDFDIGVNYRPGDQISEEEIEVALSTQLFNQRLSIDGNFGVISDQSTNNASNIVGDVNIEVKLTEDGRFRVKAFNRSNYNSIYDINSFDDIAPYTQGVGIFYRKEFNSFGDLFQRKKKKKPDKSPDLK